MDDYTRGDNEDDPIPDMSRNYGELLRFLTDDQSMRQTAKNSFKQSMWAGGGAFAGAYMLGPVGGLLGGVVGSAVGYFQSDQYDGAIQAIMKLDEERRQSLMTEVGHVLMVAGATAQQMQTPDAFHATLSRFAQQDSVRDGVWRACLASIQN